MRRPKRLLVVDDDFQLSERIRVAVQGRYEAVLSGGSEGWKRVRDGEPFDIVLSEVRLPNITATEMSHLAAKAAGQALPLVFMTTGVLSDAELAFVRNTPHLVLLKPFGVGQMLLYLETATDAPKGPRE